MSFPAVPPLPDRDTRVLCEVCGAQTAELGYEFVHDGNREAELWALYPIDGSTPPRHRGHATELRCGDCGHRQMVKASTLGAQVERTGGPAFA